MTKNNLSQSILDCLGAGIIAIDKETKVCFVNSFAEKILGWPHEELIHQPISLLLKDQMLDKATLFFKKNGESFSVEYFRTPLLEGTKNHGSVLVFFDVTERKTLEQQKDEFISNLSHELRSPLTIIKGAIWNLKDGVMGKLTDKQTKLVETTSRHIDNLSRLIENVLEVSRLQSGKATIHRRRVNLLHLIEEVVSDYHLIAKEKYIQLREELPKELPSAYVDGDAVTQVLHNLLNNALRFARKKIWITAQPSLVKGFLQVGVLDDGLGIAKEDQGRLFNKFEQLQRPSGAAGYKGTGLGLSICKEIVAHHQGKIWVESELGEGAQFYFTLPQYDPVTDLRFALRQTMDEASRSGTPLALAVIALDNFRSVKGGKGQELETILHGIEDEVKKSSLRKKDLLFRYTLKDFVMILPQTPAEGAATIATRVEQLIQERLVTELHLVQKPLLRVGIVSYPNDATSVDRLLEVALERIKKGEGEMV